MSEWFATTEATNNFRVSFILLKNVRILIVLLLLRTLNLIYSITWNMLFHMLLYICRRKWYGIKWCPILLTLVVSSLTIFDDSTVVSTSVGWFSNGLRSAAVSWYCWTQPSSGFPRYMVNIDYSSAYKHLVHRNRSRRRFFAEHNFSKRVLRRYS